ncbi:MAG TPA: hypothetical protein VJ526_02255 [Beijerinckiaceae bacterium]|nr:hypothetical protein [Beijerinckiaceae bacterium]
MITETGQDRPGQEEKDPTAGKGQPRSEGEGVARPGSDAGGAAAQPRARTSAEAGGDGGGGAGAGGNNAADAAAADDPEPAEQLAEIAESVALAEVMKPVATATEDLYATAPDKVKARRAIVDDYAKALSTPPGDLLAKYDAADRRFVRTAQDMAETLEGWIERLLTDAGGTSAVARALRERAQLRSRVAALTGGREGARLLAQAETKWWADRFADWSAPGAKMSALVADYAGKIEKLNADINNDINADLAIFSFWFEIAPKHLQLRNEPLDDEVIEKQIDDLKTALGPDSDLAAQFELGSARQDGSLYLIPADALEQRRRDVLAGWKGAAERQATAEADYKLRPDDAGALKQRWDKLKDDGWLKQAKSALEKPAA